MKNVNIGIIGCGTVGINVVKILEKHSGIIKNRVGCGINIKWVCDKDLSKLKQLNLPSEKITSDVNKLILDPSVDILVEFKPTAKIGFFEFVRLQRRLSDFVGKKVDLLTPEAISKFFREKVVKEAELIYGGK